MLKVKQMFKVTVQTQQQCINISILLWQHVSVLLDHFSCHHSEIWGTISAYHVLCDPMLLTRRS